MASTNKLTFKVTRKDPILIPPAEPTPYEFKYLSGIDKMDALRAQIPMIHFYRQSPSMDGTDPVNIIRDAFAKTLVFYYPFAGRLRDYDCSRKLVVECTGEGVVFIEADADVMLHQFGDSLHPPFPNLEELLCDVSGSGGIINSPLLHIQVTLLRCGGFILGYRFTHTMCDGAGILQFISAVAELARGAAVPSIPPVWQRHLLTVNSPKSGGGGGSKSTSFDKMEMVQRAFFFGATEIGALHRSLPPHLRSCTRFEVVSALLWRCWAIAVHPEPHEEIIFGFPMDIRNRTQPPLPLGYYGNAIVAVEAVTTAEKLSENPLQYAVELVRKAKSEAMLGDPIVPRFGGCRVYAVSDMKNLDYRKVDFGWGKAEYGGLAEMSRNMTSLYIAFKNTKGEEGILVPVNLPINAMEVFLKQLQMIVTVPSVL